jgi:hypothetical protein
MWSKIYVSIIVLIVLILLNSVNSLIRYSDNVYQLKKKYNIPTDCMSTAICGMNGNILLIFIIYMLIPDTYFKSAMQLLDPRQFDKITEDDILGINGKPV